MPKICANCGKEDEGDFVGAFCRSCFAFTHELYSIPRLEAKLCTKCNKLFLAGEWGDFSSTRLSSFLSSKIKFFKPLKKIEVNSFLVEGKSLVIEASFYLDVSGFVVTKFSRVPVSLKKSLCLHCSRHSGSYFEAIIQLRGSKCSCLFNELLSRIPREQVSKIEELKEGIDVYVVSERVALNAVSGFRHSISKKLVGVKDGKRVYRTTICVRK